MRLRARLWALGAFVFMRAWYGFTQMVTRKRDVVVPTFSSPHEIITYLQFGRLYKTDPIKGVLDVAQHATSVAKKVNAGSLHVGDCDDHAIVWCYGLTHNHLSTHTYFATLRMQDVATGELSAHALVVYRDGTKRYWADYRDPSEFENDWDWAVACALTFNAVPVAATLTDVRGLSKRGRVQFGRMRTRTWEVTRG